MSFSYYKYIIKYLGSRYGLYCESEFTKHDTDRLMIIRSEMDYYYQTGKVVDINNIHDKGVLLGMFRTVEDIEKFYDMNEPFCFADWGYCSNITELYIYAYTKFGYDRKPKVAKWSVNCLCDMVVFDLDVKELEYPCLNTLWDLTKRIDIRYTKYFYSVLEKVVATGMGELEKLLDCIRFYFEEIKLYPKYKELVTVLWKKYPDNLFVMDLYNMPHLGPGWFEALERLDELNDQYKKDY